MNHTYVLLMSQVDANGNTFKPLKVILNMIHRLLLNLPKNLSQYTICQFDKSLYGIDL